MASYHVFQCDRCGLVMNGQCDTSVPQYWTKVDTYSSLHRKGFLLCAQCYGDIARFIGDKETKVTSKAVDRA